VAPLKDAKAWQPFMRTVFAGLLAHAEGSDRSAPTLVLWGKIAEQLHALAMTESFPKAVSEHPYNLSFIANSTMQTLFQPMGLLKKNNSLSPG
jgi:uracil-DNA glycosylase